MFNRSLPGPWVFVIIGLLTLLATMVSVFHTRHWNAVAVTTSGRVVELRPEVRHRKHDSDETVYRTIVDYAGDDEQRRLVESYAASTVPSNAVGDAVTVSYLPREPAKARIDDPANIWGPAHTLVLFSVAAFFCALVSAFRVMRDAATSRADEAGSFSLDLTTSPTRNLFR